MRARFGRAADRKTGTRTDSNPEAGKRSFVPPAGPAADSREEHGSIENGCVNQSIGVSAPVSTGRLSLTALQVSDSAPDRLESMTGLAPHSVVG